MGWTIGSCASATRQHGRDQGNPGGRGRRAWAGLSPKVRSGVLAKPFEGVSVISGSPATWERAVSIAVMATANHAVASHATAGHLWGLARRPRVIEVTRTVVDVGVPRGGVFADRCLDEAVRSGLTTDGEVAALVHRVARKGRNGVGPIRVVLMTRLGWGGLTESQIESECLRILRAAGLDLPEPQVRIHRKDGRLISVSTWSSESSCSRLRSMASITTRIAGPFHRTDAAKTTSFSKVIGCFGLPPSMCWPHPSTSSRRLSKPLPKPSGLNSALHHRLGASPGSHHP